MFRITKKTIFLGCEPLPLRFHKKIPGSASTYPFITFQGLDEKKTKNNICTDLTRKRHISINIWRRKHHRTFSCRQWYRRALSHVLLAKCFLIFRKPIVNNKKFSRTNGHGDPVSLQEIKKIRTNILMFFVKGQINSNT